MGNDQKEGAAAMTMSHQSYLETIQQALPSLAQVVRELEAYEVPMAPDQCTAIATTIQTIKEGVERLKAFDKQRPGGGFSIFVTVALDHALTGADKARLHLAVYQAICQRPVTQRHLQTRQEAAHSLRQLLAAANDLLARSQQNKSTEVAHVAAGGSSCLQKHQRAGTRRHAAAAYLRVVGVKEEEEAIPQEEKDQTPQQAQQSRELEESLQPDIPAGIRRAIQELEQWMSQHHYRLVPDEDTGGGLRLVPSDDCDRSGGTDPASQEEEAQP
jgi:hypothetical protein